jgi:UDP-2,3-diacylglucosamine hydrolase
MGIALVADAHLGGVGGSAGHLAGQLEALTGQGCERLVLLGDIFHVWVGARRFETPAIRTIHGILRSLAGAGVVIDYIEGNRDFFLAESPYAGVFSSIGSELVVESRGRRILIVHGDGLNPSDRQYLFWRWLSKSRLSRALILNLPTAVARQALHRTEAGLARTNFEHRQGIPRDAITGFAERRLAEGFDLLILGHYHEEAEWEVRGGTVRIVDAWFNSHRVEWL